MSGTVPLNLDRCIRCVPHDENTGGFFVTLLRKVCELDNATTSEGKDNTEAAAEPEESVAKRPKIDPVDRELSGKGQVHGEYYRPVDTAFMTGVKSFFEVNDDFPFDQLFTRNEGAAKTITYLTKTVKENVIDGGRQDRLKVRHQHRHMVEKEGG